MRTPEIFDDIRPFEPEELPEVFDRLLGDKQFMGVMRAVMPQVSEDDIARKIRTCKTNMDFQLNLCYGFLKGLLARASTSCSMDCSAISKEERYTFVSNHRDIVLDSALLEVMLVDNGFETTCEIAIGDNLLAAPWIEDLVRVNKSFIVKRSASMREMLASSKKMADYMHYVIAVKRDNIWIAQREGRAKDSDDRTQEALLKMMAMGGEGDMRQRLMSLNIVPLSISYEYDPCDYLKAMEFQLKRDVEGWQKSREDDVLSMKTGIMGYKGAIHYDAAPPINNFLESLDKGMPKGGMLKAIATHIDKEIHRRYKLYPSNIVALDLLDGGVRTGLYTEEQKRMFLGYIDGQLAKIDIPGKDEDYLRERMLTMYANPARNKIRADGEI